MLYASLTGPLLNIYYPLPFNDHIKNRVALNESKLRSLWCSVYTEEEVDKYIRLYGGLKLHPSFAEKLDYDTKVEQA